MAISAAAVVCLRVRCRAQSSRANLLQSRQIWQYQQGALRGLIGMANRQNDRSFFTSPQTVVYLLIAANVFIYGLVVRQAGTAAIPGDVLLRNGAMYSFAIARHEYWRLVAYGFLHTNLLHLTANMICLVLWGGHLERRVGAFYFVVIYVCALIAGAAVSNVAHSGPYLTVGASGAISGVLGALLSLWILGRIELSASFFAINIGLNAALAASAPGIDWGAHVGGFAAGMVVCALLDIVEKANALVLRCKFPEFVKFNTAVVVGGVAFALWGDNPTGVVPSTDLWPMLGYFIACCIAVKLVDLVLAIKKGVAIVALGFAVANAALVLFAGAGHAPLSVVACTPDRLPNIRWVETMRAAACANLNVTLDITATCALALTLLLYAPDIQRGIKDVGFVGASLRAERKRRWGI
jgi:membrane associated rhomboid family serine protease